MAGPIYRPIHETSTEAEAHAIKGYLKDNGVKAVIRSQRPDFHGGNTPGSSIPSRHLAPQMIHVEKHEMQKARALVSAYMRHNRKV